MRERDPEAIARDLRSIVGDGVAFSVMVGLGETYVPAFALASGLGQVAAGLVATLPVIAGATLQLATPAAVGRLRSYRVWVVGCAALQAASFAPLVAGALLGGISQAALFTCMSVYWAAGMATSPAWNAWVGELVPAEQRAHFFAQRSRLCQLALFVAILAGGLVLQQGDAADRPLHAFALLFALAAVFRLASSGFLARQHETPGLASGHRRLSPPAAWAVLREAGARRVLIYLLGMQIAVHLVAPYFTPYMLGPLGLSYAGYMTLTAAAFVSRIVVLPALGRWSHARGARALFRVGAITIVPLPVLWLVSDHFAYLLAIQLLSGVAWGALEFATMMSFFETLEDRDRASVLTMFNFANTLAMVLGSLLGALLLRAVAGVDGYALLFIVSSLARLLALVLLPRPAPPRHGLESVTLRTLGVRPSAGVIERPIVSTLETADEAPESEPR